jgi:hypothetical protein
VVLSGLSTEVAWPELRVVRVVEVDAASGESALTRLRYGIWQSVKISDPHMIDTLWAAL